MSQPFAMRSYHRLHELASLYVNQGMEAKGDGDNRIERAETHFFGAVKHPKALINSCFGSANNSYWKVCLVTHLF